MSGLDLIDVLMSHPNRIQITYAIVCGVGEGGQTPRRQSFQAAGILKGFSSDKDLIVRSEDTIFAQLSCTYLSLRPYTLVPFFSPLMTSIPFP